MEGYKYNIKNRTAFITGGNRGLGLGLVKTLLDAGAKHVHATARSDSGLSILKTVDPERVSAHRVDIGNEADCAAAAQAAKDVDLLINNAACKISHKILESSREELQKDLDTNLFGTINTIRAFVPYLRQNSDKEPIIVNILSIVSFAAMPSLAGYCVSKAAAMSMTQALQTDLARDNIAVLGAYPGPIDTDMNKGLDIEMASIETVANAILEGIKKGEKYILPDSIGRNTYETWVNNPQAVIDQFAGY